MDSEFVEFLAHFPELQFVDPIVQRAAMAQMRSAVEPPPWPEGVTPDERFVPGPGDAKVPVRVYTPSGAQPDAAVVIWIHGGGYCVGTAEEDEPACARLAAHLSAVVVSVEYRLAPEDPYPAGLDDCYSVLDHVATGSAAGYPTGPLIVAGASAGAGLAAALALRARDWNGPAIHAQILLYPFLDATMSGASLRTLSDSPVFNAEDARVCWAHYLGEEVSAPPVYGSPSVADHLSGLPQAYVLVAGADCLRDEAVDYAVRLQAAGVPTELHLVPGVPHGFAALHPAASTSKRASAELLAVLNRMISQGDRGASMGK